MRRSFARDCPLAALLRALFLDVDRDVDRALAPGEGATERDPRRVGGGAGGTAGRLSSGGENAKRAAAGAPAGAAEEDRERANEDHHGG
jgi:hypothetical protein